MNAPHHGIHGKLAEWKEQTTFRAFLLGSGVPDAEDVRMALQVLKTHMERLGEDGQGIGFQLNGEHVQRSKLRIETRLKLLAKWDPRRYGDRLALDHGVQDNLAERLKAARERSTAG